MFVASLPCQERRDDVVAELLERRDASVARRRVRRGVLVEIGVELRILDRADEERHDVDARRDASGRRRGVVARREARKVTLRLDERAQAARRVLKADDVDGGAMSGAELVLCRQRFDRLDVALGICNDTTDNM